MFDAQANEDGINLILNIIYSCGINKNILLGYLEHEEIYTRCRALWRELAKLFAFHSHLYGIKKETRSQLVKSIVWLVHSGLSRSQDGKEADQLSSATQKIEHRLIEQNKEQGRGGFPLNPLKVFHKR